MLLSFLFVSMMHVYADESGVSVGDNGVVMQQPGVSSQLDTQVLTQQPLKRIANKRATQMKSFSPDQQMQQKKQAASGVSALKNISSPFRKHPLASLSAENK